MKKQSLSDERLLLFYAGAAGLASKVNHSLSDL